MSQDSIDASGIEAYHLSTALTLHRLGNLGETRNRSPNLFVIRSHLFFRTALNGIVTPQLFDLESIDLDVSAFVAASPLEENGRVHLSKAVDLERFFAIFFCSFRTIDHLLGTRFEH